MRESTVDSSNHQEGRRRTVGAGVLAQVEHEVVVHVGQGRGGPPGDDLRKRAGGWVGGFGRQEKHVGGWVGEEERETRDPSLPWQSCPQSSSSGASGGFGRRAVVEERGVGRKGLIGRISKRVEQPTTSGCCSMYRLPTYPPTLNVVHFSGWPNWALRMRVSTLGMPTYPNRRASFPSFLSVSLLLGKGGGG